MKELLESHGKVKTTIDGRIVQDKQYKINYDGNNVKMALYDGDTNKLVLGRLSNDEIKDLLVNKNNKQSLKDNLEKLLPKKKEKKKRSTKKNKAPKRRRKSKKRGRKGENKMLKDFLNFFD
tara:strand:+ start:10118 stop:10480 length:363 start_codon:yes stop_codon:yes gene_type:complete